MDWGTALGSVNLPGLEDRPVATCLCRRRFQQPPEPPPPPSCCCLACCCKSSRAENTRRRTTLGCLSAWLSVEHADN